MRGIWALLTILGVGVMDTAQGIDSLWRLLPLAIGSCMATVGLLQLTEPRGTS